MKIYLKSIRDLACESLWAGYELANYLTHRPINLEEIVSK